MSEPADYEAALDVALDAFMRDKHRGEWDASSRDDMRRAIAAYHAVQTGADYYEAKAREFMINNLCFCDGFGNLIVMLAKSAAEMRERCEAIARAYEDGQDKMVRARVIADAIAALVEPKASP